MNITIKKRNLAIYLLTLSLSIAFSSFYGGPVSFSWLYAVLLLIPLSALYIFVNFTFLKIYQEVEAHRLTKGEVYNYRILIANDGPFPIHKMRLLTYDDRCTLFAIQNKKEVSLSVIRQKEITSGIVCKYAGSYNVGIGKVLFEDPFKIFAVALEIPYTFRAVVSPRITDIAGSALELENPYNSTLLKSNTLYEETPGIDTRPYQKGDPLKTINWKLSAKLSEFVTRIPDRMEKRTVSIIMQASNIAEKDQDTEFLKKRDYFLEFSVSAAWHFARQNVPVRLVFPAGKVFDITVDSYDSFLTFYNRVSDGIFYSSSSEISYINDMVTTKRSTTHAHDAYIIIREDPDPGENNFIICG